MAVVLGLNAKLFYATPGANPTYAELSNVRNVTLSLETAEADVTVRANNGWRATLPTLKDSSIEWEMIYDTADAGFLAIQSAFFGDANNPNGKDILLKVLDGGTASSGTGLVSTCRITSFSISQSLEEAVTVSVSAKPTYGAAAPVWQNPSQGSENSSGSGS